jgi:chromosome segregation ATPase
VAWTDYFSSFYLYLPCLSLLFLASVPFPLLSLLLPSSPLRADRESLRLAHLAREDELKKEADKLRSELEKAKADKDRDVRSLRDKFEGEVKSTRASLERENRTRREEMELRAVTVAATHAKDLATLRTRITTLQGSVTSLGETKDELFGQLQTRSEELEEERRRSGRLEVELGEVEWKLKEVGERYGSLEEEVESGRRMIEELQQQQQREKQRSLRDGATSRHVDGESDDHPSSTSSSTTTTATPREASLLSTLTALRATHAETVASLAHLTQSHAQAEAEWSVLISTRTSELESVRRSIKEREVSWREEREGWEEERRGWERVRAELERGRGERERIEEEERWGEVNAREEGWKEEEVSSIFLAAASLSSVRSFGGYRRVRKETNDGGFAC